MRKPIPLLIALLSIGLTEPILIEAQEMPSQIGTTSVLIQGSQTSTTENNPLTEVSTTTVEAPSQTTAMTVNFKAYIPYGRYINYQYQGDGSAFTQQDIIMEYAPDSQGVFQVTSFTGDSVIAYVYQIRDTGLYELACIENYNVVEDLRYSTVAQDGQESLIIPSNLTVGNVYQSGYNKENTRTIVDFYDALTLNGVTFNNVFKILEENADASQSYYYYLAQDYGIILVEKVDTNGVPYGIIQFVQADGALY